MAQSKVLLRFRARLRSRGYSNISIVRSCLDDVQDFWTYGHVLYKVSCVEPVLGFDLEFYCTEMQMDNWPGIPFDLGIFKKQADLFEEMDGDGISV